MNTSIVCILVALAACGDQLHPAGSDAPSPPGDAQAPPGILTNTPDRTYVADGDVNAIARVGNTIYLGGGFTRLGARTGPGVQLALDGIARTDVAEISGAGPNPAGGAATGLRAVVADGAGGWYISGLFTHVGGAVRSNLAHLLGDGSVDPSFGPIVDGNVEALALRGPTLYLAGQFTTVAGVARSNIAAVAIADGSVTSFDPSADAEVAALAVSSDGAVVYAGGNGFTTIGGQSRGSLAALDPVTGAAVASFHPIVATTAGPANIQALAVSGSTLYVAGYFDTVNGVARRTIAALDATGASVATFAPTPSYVGCIPCASVVALAVSGSTVFVGGSFDTIGGHARNNIAALDATTGAATAFDPDASGNILALATTGTTVFVGGGFYAIGGANRNFAAALDATTGLATAFDPNPNNTINAIAATGSSVYLGGSFSSLGGVARAGLAAIDATTGIPTSWDPHAAGMNGNLALISTVAVADTTLYVAGSFVSVGGHARDNIAELDLATGAATAWNPSSDGVIQTMVVSGSLVYVGGDFIHLGGQQRVFIAALDRVSGLATAWDPSADNSVHAIAATADTVYVGGLFGGIGGQPRAGLAAIDSATGLATAWSADLGPGMFGSYVYALAIDGPSLYLGGGFASVQGVSRHNAAAVSLVDATPTAFDPSSSGGGDDGTISALAVAGDTVFLGGSFTTIGAEPRGLVGAVSATTGGVLDFDPDASGGVSVHAFAVADDTSLYVGGSFPTLALASQQGFAAFSPHPQ